MKNFLKIIVVIIGVVLLRFYLPAYFSDIHPDVQIYVDPKVGQAYELHWMFLRKVPNAAYAIFSVDISNNSNKPVTVIPSQFVLVDTATSTTYKQDLSAAWALPRGYPQPNSVITVNPGVPVRVNLIFDIPTWDLFLRNELLMYCDKGIEGKSAKQSFTVYNRNVYKFQIYR